MEVGLDLELFEDPDNDISFVDVGRLLNLCAERTGIPHFGLLLGQQAGPGSIGALAELATCAPDVGSALKSMILHVCVNDRGGVPTLTCRDGIAKLGYAIYIPLHEGTKQVYSASLAIICNLLRSLCGETWSPSKVFFSCAWPSDIKPYESFFRAPLTFQADEDALIFPERCLRQPIPSCDVGKYETTMERLTSIENTMAIDFQEKLRPILRPLVVSNRCSLGNLAQILAMHPRTLNRRLKDRGMTFRGLVSEIRYEIAKQMLTDSDMRLIRISTLLGYADASVFTRAFRRWSGITPSVWRIQYKHSEYWKSERI